MHQDTSHRDHTMDTDYRPTRYGSTDYDRVQKAEEGHSKAQNKTSYKNLIWMGVIHIPLMYFIMFSMVDTFGDVYQNLNTFYMALMMATPMVALMPFMMKDMYKDKKKNVIVVVGSLILFLVSFFAIRYQSAIGDSQFIRSMIPHHSGAILMCREANLVDPELRGLCGNIYTGQRKEIEQMNKILERLDQ